MDINFYVQSDKLTSDIKQPISGNVNFYRCVFAFSEEWDITAKYAVFSRSGKTYTVELKENSCFIPAEVLTESGYITIGVFGTNGSENDYLRISSNAVTVYVGTGAYEDGETPTPPTPDVWERIKAELDRLSQKAEETDKKIFDAEDDINTLSDKTEAVEKELSEADKKYAGIDDVMTNYGNISGEKPNRSVYWDYDENAIVFRDKDGVMIPSFWATAASYDFSGNVIHETYAEKANAITKKLKSSDETDISPVTYSFNGNSLMFADKDGNTMSVEYADKAIHDDLYQNIRETYATKEEMKTAVESVDLSDCIQYGDETDIEYMRGNTSNERPTLDSPVIYSPCCYRYDNCIIIASTKITRHEMTDGVSFYYYVKTTQIRIDSEQNITTRYGTWTTSDGNANFPRIAMLWGDWYEYITTKELKTAIESVDLSEYAKKDEVVDLVLSALPNAEEVAY